MFEHEQLLAQHKEACVMVWRRRSGNLIALRVEEGERRGDRLLQLAGPRAEPSLRWGKQTALGNP